MKQWGRMPKDQKGVYVPTFVLMVIVVLSALCFESMLLFTGMQLALEAGATKTASVQNASLLFVQQGTGGTLVKKNDAHTYTLSLTGVPTHMTWFTDRPQRTAGTLPVSAFVEQWSTYGFDEYAPNAALDLAEADEDEDTVIIELSEPVWAEDTQTITYTVNVLQDSNNERLAHFAALADNALPESFGSASLFIDNANGKSVNGCYIGPYTSCPDGDMTGQNLVKASLAGSNFVDADFTGANLIHADFSNAFLYGADFTDAQLAGINVHGAKISGQQFTTFQKIGYGLSDFDFSYDSDFSGLNFSNQDWSGSMYLTGANFSDANFTGANLASFLCDGCNFVEANFTNADLTGTNFRGSNMTDADFTGATMSQTGFYQATLTGANPDAAAVSTNLNCPDGSFADSCQ